MEFRNPSTPLTIDQSENRKIVYKQISSQPETFYMGAWYTETPEWLAELKRANNEPCHTTRCVAGWSQFFAHGGNDQETVRQDAVTAMGLTWEEYRGVGDEGLFYATDWAAVSAMKILADVVPG